MRALPFAILALILLPAGIRDAEAAEWPDDETWKALIAEASVIDAEAAKRIEGLGLLVTWADLAPKGSATLPSVLLALGALPYSDPNREAACVRCSQATVGPYASGMTCRDCLALVDAVSGMKNEAGPHPRTMLPARNIKRLATRQEGDAVLGDFEFTFAARLYPDSESEYRYEGRFVCVMRRSAEGWRIDEFRLPGCGLRVFRRDGKWTVEEESRPGTPWTPKEPEEREVPDVALPKVESAGALGAEELPPSRLTIGIRADGRMAFRERVDFAFLEHNLLTVRFWYFRVLPDGSRDVDLLLRVEATAPWALVNGVLATAVKAGVRTRRQFLLVRTGEGKPLGAVPFLLPEGWGTEEKAVGRAVVRLKPAAGEPEPAAVLDFLLKRLAPRANSPIVVEVAPGVAAGCVTRAVALIPRADVHPVVFKPPPPPAKTAATPTYPPSPKEFVAANPVKAPGWSITVGGETLAPKPPPPK